MNIQLKLTLKGNKPPVWARLHVDSLLTVADLYDYLDEIFAFAFEDVSITLPMRLGYSLQSSKTDIEFDDFFDGPFAADTERQLTDSAHAFVSDFLIEPGDKGLLRSYESGMRIDILLEEIKEWEKDENPAPYCVGCSRGMVDYLNTSYEEDDEEGDCFGEELSSPAEAANELNENLSLFQHVEERELPGFSTTSEYEDDWPSLIEATMAFADLQPWQWINSNQILALDLPNQSERVYCCILGQMGNEYGAAVYVGDQGLRQIRQEIDHVATFDRIPHATIFHLSLCRPGVFPNADRAFFNLLDMDVNLWEHYPLLRVEKPGFAPWIPQGEEISLVSEILDKLAELALDYQEKAKDFPYYSDAAWFHRNYTIDSLDVEKPHDGTITPAMDDLEWTDSEPWASAIDLQRLKKTRRQTKSWIELGGNFASLLIAQEDSDQALFPWIQLAVDHSTGQPLHVQLVDDVQIIGKEEPFSREAQNFLIQMIEKTGQRPSGLLVNQQEFYHSLHLLCQKLGIICNLSEHLPKFEDAFISIEDNLGHGD